MSRLYLDKWDPELFIEQMKGWRRLKEEAFEKLTVNFKNEGEEIRKEIAACEEFIRQNPKT